MEPLYSPDFDPNLANFELLQPSGPTCPFLMPLPSRCDSSARPCGRIQAQVLAYSNDLGPCRAHQVGYSLPCRSVGADAGRLGGRHPQPLGLKISLEVLVASKSCRRRSFRIVVNCVHRAVIYPKINMISGGTPMGLRDRLVQNDPRQGRRKRTASNQPSCSADRPGEGTLGLDVAGAFVAAESPF